MDEESVHARSGAADIGPESTRLEQPLGKRRRTEIVRREACDVTGLPDSSERVEKLRPPGLEPGGSVTRVEGAVHISGGCLHLVVGQNQHDPEVLREVDRREDGAVARAELGAAPEEERHVGSDRGGKVLEPFAFEWSRKQFVRQP